MASIKKPGELSHWISVAEYIRGRAAGADDELKKSWTYAAGVLAGVDVRIKTLTARGRCELYEREGGEKKTLLSMVDTNEAWVSAGLGDIRGIDNLDGLAVGDPALVEALSASDMIHVLAAIISDYNRLPAAERAAFFTAAPAA